MKFTTFPRIVAGLLVAGGLIVTLPSSARAHCDTMDGPVIAAARQALDTGNINLALVWVQPGDEAAIRDEFIRARAARQAGGTSQEAAERRFFEAFVRIHRAGEGAPYTGIKPAGTPIDSGVRAADRSLETNSVDQTHQLLTHAVQSGLQRNFDTALKLRDYAPDDVAAGRDYVKAYVTYTHFVEAIHRAATGSAHQHEAANEHGEDSGHGAGQAAAHQSHDGHAAHADHLPWILVAVLGLALIGETVFIVFGRRSRAA